MDKKEDISELKSRLIDFCNALGITPRSFSISIGKSPTYISSMKENITVEVINNILFKYPNINIYWLLNGQGDMLNDSTTVVNNKDKNATIEVSAEAWNIIKTQAEVMSIQAKSLEHRDAQIDDLINMLKKGVAHQADDVGCADAVESGS